MRRPTRFTLPAAFIAAACGSPVSQTDAGYDAGHDAGPNEPTDAGHDAGYDAGPNEPVDAGPCGGDNVQVAVISTDDAGVRCACEYNFIEPQLSDGGYPLYQECDPDVGNPCNFGCFNAMETDGGREYYADAGPICFC